MIPDGHRVQPLIAHGCSELASTAVLLLQPSIPTKAVVCTTGQHSWITNCLHAAAQMNASHMSARIKRAVDVT